MATDTELELFEETKIKHPKKYKVIMLNDNYTSMEFVVDVLMSIFHKNYEQAQDIMLEIHKKDKAVCGVYTHEIAETKVMQVLSKAKKHTFPLKAIMEEE
ncbi:MAG: ATP-dependent Clp protease adapter ClpS [Epsilonproteobacteria bacterium]|nr:ATP-dependent Clp protease adapter ClpS [Campylobacterota bacterium]